MSIVNDQSSCCDSRRPVYFDKSPGTHIQLLELLFYRPNFNNYMIFRDQQSFVEDTSVIFDRFVIHDILISNINFFHVNFEQIYTKCCLSMKMLTDLPVWKELRRVCLLQSWPQSITKRSEILLTWWFATSPMQDQFDGQLIWMNNLPLIFEYLISVES